MQGKTRLFSALCVLLASLLISAFRWKGETPILVVPGKSIAGVELGMSRDKVISLLGKPSKEISSKDLAQIGQFRVLGGGTITGKIARITVLTYSAPPLFISLHEDNKVGAIQLGHTESVRVEGYDFLKFRYLTKEEIKRIGKPSSVTRDGESEQQMLSMAPQGTKIEYYVYEYDQLGLILAFVFDRTKEQSSRYFIGLNHIAISSRKVLPSPR